MDKNDGEVNEKVKDHIPSSLDVPSCVDTTDHIPSHSLDAGDQSMIDHISPLPLEVFNHIVGDFSNTELSSLFLTSDVINKKLDNQDFWVKKGRKDLFLDLNHITNLSGIGVGMSMRMKYVEVRQVFRKFVSDVIMGTMPSKAERNKVIFILKQVDSFKFATKANPFYEHWCNFMTCMFIPRLSEIQITRKNNRYHMSDVNVLPILITTIRQASSLHRVLNIFLANYEKAGSNKEDYDSICQFLEQLIPNRLYNDMSLTLDLIRFHANHNILLYDYIMKRLMRVNPFDQDNLRRITESIRYSIPDIFLYASDLMSMLTKTSSFYQPIINECLTLLHDNMLSKVDSTLINVLKLNGTLSNVNILADLSSDLVNSDLPRWMKVDYRKRLIDYAESHPGSMIQENLTIIRNLNL